MSLNCPSCGATLKADDRYCGECGRKLADEPVNATDTPTSTAGSERASGQKSSFAIVGLIVVGVVLIGVGAYQVIRSNVAEPEQAISTPRPAPAQPKPPAPAAAPKRKESYRKEAARTPPSQPEHGCGKLTAPGETLVCDAFEPSWSIAFRCEGSRLTTSFTDFFSSADLLKTPGTATLQSQDPWSFRTSQGLAGTVAATPGGCLDDGGQTLDFTLTPKVVPGLEKPETICCRIAR